MNCPSHQSGREALAVTCSAVLRYLISKRVNKNNINQTAPYCTFLAICFLFLEGLLPSDSCSCSQARIRVYKYWPKFFNVQCGTDGGLVPHVRLLRMASQQLQYICCLENVQNCQMVSLPHVQNWNPAV